MLLCRRAPRPELRAFVASLWSFEGQFGHELERILPSATMQLLVNLHEDETRTYHGASFGQVHALPGAVVQGPHAEHFGIDTAEQRCIVGVHFRPGGAAPFFSAPAREMLGLHVDLVALWGPCASLLRERLLEAGSPAQRLDVLERELLRRAVKPLDPDPIVTQAAAALDGHARVSDVLERMGVGRKRFVRRFTEAVGLSPKRYARVRRFHRVLHAVDAASSGMDGVDWAVVALDYGFFDQAHLIHEFRAFSGLTPTAYGARAPGEVSHVKLEG